MFTKTETEILYQIDLHHFFLRLFSLFETFIARHKMNCIKVTQTILYIRWTHLSYIETYNRIGNLETGSVERHSDRHTDISSGCSGPIC